MKFVEISQIVEAKILTAESSLVDIKTIYVSDLMSDVLTYGREAQMLVTSLSNQQTVRTVEMIEIPVICYTNGKILNDETIELARQKGIAVLTTGLSTFQVIGRLFDAGLEG